MEGSGCKPLTIGRGAGCREEVRMVNGLKVGRWRRENEKKGEQRSKGIESTRDEEMRMRGACKMARAHNGVNWGAGASNARKDQAMGFGEEDGAVGWGREWALGHHLHRGEQRWTLDERPSQREKDSVLTEMEILVKDVQRDIATHPTQRSQTTSAGNYLIPIAEQTGEPHPSPIVYSCSPAYFDGLEVLDPLRSCDKQAGESSSRCFYKAKAYTVCYFTVNPTVSKSTYLSCLALRGKLRGCLALCMGNAEV
jgi:hypothetical protein